MDNSVLYQKLANLPESLKAEVSNFIDLLLKKHKQKAPSKKPKFGSGKGMFKLKPGFDEPLQDFNDYMH